MREYWRLLANQTDPETGRRQRTELETLGWMTETAAETARRRAEAALVLGLEPTTSVTAFRVRDALADLVQETDDGPRGQRHKDRTFQDANNLGRVIGDIVVDKLGPAHVRRYVSVRSAEAVVRVRPRHDETDEEYAERVARDRQRPDGKRVSRSTIHAELVTLRRAIKYAGDSGRTNARPPAVPKKSEFVTDARPARRLVEPEVRRLVNAAYAAEGDRICEGLGELVETLAWSGRRPVALFSLTVGDCRRLVDPALGREQRLVYFRRDKADRGRGWAPLTEPAYRSILARLQAIGEAEPDRLVWQTYRGLEHRSDSFRNLFHRRVAEAAEIEDVRPYDLRKHACAQLLRTFGNPHECIRFTGHKTVEVFLRDYAYAMGDAEKMASRVGWTPAALKVLDSEV